MFQHLISRYGSRLCDFWYESQKKAKKPVRDRGLQGWNDVAVWRDFELIYIPEDIWPHYLEHVILSDSHNAHSLVLATKISQFMAR